MRDSKTTVFTKTIAIDPEDLRYVEKIKGKKSRAGKLKEMIQFYKENVEKLYE